MRYQQRMERLVERKIQQTREKLAALGARDEDDYGLVLPPEGFVPELPIRDENGSFAGAYAWGRNFRYLMENLPVYIDPDDALAGRWMFMLSRMRLGYKLYRSNFAFDYSELVPLQEKYDITSGIGKDAHFAPDYQIGLSLGWGGLLDKARAALEKFGHDPAAKELFEAEIDAIEGIQCWVRHLALAARDRAMTEYEPERKQNLIEMAQVCFRLISAPPETLREACQWLALFNMASRTYNRDGAGGQLDELLRPYYERDLAAGRIDDEDVEFYLFCLLLNDPHYYQLGGPGEDGRDMASPLSFLILEAAAKLKSSCNLTIRVHDGMDRRLFRRGVEILLENKLGYPRFSGDKALVSGFMKNGYSAELARRRIALGCNWMSLPGLEYTMNDLVKINMAKVFEVAFREYQGDDLAEFYDVFRKDLLEAIACIKAGIDFHLKNQYRNAPELLLNLVSHGPIEKGRDASHGGLQYYNIAIDGAGIATVADSFAALELHCCEKKDLSWDQVRNAIAVNFEGPEADAVRRILKNTPMYGYGGTEADGWALRISRFFTERISQERTPEGHLTIPGLFSWANTVPFGKQVGATPNGRRAGEPINHGANPNNGFRKDGAFTAAAKAIAAVQPGYGNTAPFQLELNDTIIDRENAIENVAAVLKGHFDMGGTLVNVNIVDKDQILAANEDPSAYPNLIVRVTGFTAYFSALSPEFRQLVVDRIISL